ncbi:MAG: thiamine-phosphate kinase [Chloroflexi bacterium]|nr:thiamine-phosphate kinase [Chloroflexota bacterium]
MRLGDLGEFELIQLLKEDIETFRDAGKPAWQRLLLGAGDDCASWKGSTLHQLATTDTMVQGVHFLQGTFRYEDLGHKAIASNLSDIAAMGGIPRYALVSFSANSKMKVDEMRSLFHGMLQEASAYGVAVVGGNVTKSPLLVITITIIGELPGESMLLRTGARLGDQIGVTGYLGNAGAAVAAFRRKLKTDRATKAFLKQCHFHPQPRIMEGQELVRLGVKTAIDISDGLAGDLARICQASGVGAIVYADRLPIHPTLRKAVGKDAVQYALSGGEDFELLFTAPPELMEQVCATLKTPVTVIGKIVSEPQGQVNVSSGRGRKLKLKAKGWDHFLDK